MRIDEQQQRLEVTGFNLSDASITTEFIDGLTINGIAVNDRIAACKAAQPIEVQT